MSATGLDVFDKTLQTTHIWLDELMTAVGPDRQVAWHVLGAVLRTLRDRIPVGLAAHFGSQLPILIRGTYYDQWNPEREPMRMRSADEFLAQVNAALSNIRPVNVDTAVRAVFASVNAHVTPGQVEKIREALPEDVRRLWNPDARPAASGKQQAERAQARPRRIRRSSRSGKRRSAA